MADTLSLITGNPYAKLAITHNTHNAAHNTAHHTVCTHNYVNVQYTDGNSTYAVEVTSWRLEVSYQKNGGTGCTHFSPTIQNEFAPKAGLPRGGARLPPERFRPLLAVPILPFKMTSYCDCSQ
jgi:hypothetical protein